MGKTIPPSDIESRYRFCPPQAHQKLPKSTAQSPKLKTQSLISPEWHYSTACDRLGATEESGRAKGSALCAHACSSTVWRDLSKPEGDEGSRRAWGGSGSFGNLDGSRFGDDPAIPLDEPAVMVMSLVLFAPPESLQGRCYTLKRRFVCCDGLQGGPVR